MPAGHTQLSLLPASTYLPNALAIRICWDIRLNKDRALGHHVIADEDSIRDVREAVRVKGIAVHEIGAYEVGSFFGAEWPPR
jgi:hypothetical protein